MRRGTVKTFRARVRCPKCGLERDVDVPNERPEDAGTEFYCPEDGRRMPGV